MYTHDNHDNSSNNNSSCSSNNYNKAMIRPLLPPTPAPPPPSPLLMTLKGTSLDSFYNILTLIIIIIIAFKGAIQDFLRSPHSAANHLQHIRSSGLGAIVCKSRATHRALITCKCQVPCHLVRRDSSAIKFDRIEIAFI